tara:strand:- start:332 stop:1606 length:1275 start_codon:yes stop_codon:yes gene_type:complete
MTATLDPRNPYEKFLFSKLDPIIALRTGLGASPVSTNVSQWQQRGGAALAALGLFKEKDKGFTDFAFKMGVDLGGSVTIAVVGCGGTGSHLVPTMLQYIASARLTQPEDVFPRIKVLLIDGDIVESKNLIRQRFSSYELGVNKAEALATRYSGIYDLPIFHVNEFLTVENSLQLLDINNNQSRNQTRATSVNAASSTLILIGAVDNHQARSVIHNFFLKAQNDKRNIFWIDAGNEDTFGQVVLGYRGASEYTGTFYSDDFLNSIEGWSKAGIGELVAPFDLPCFFDRYPDLYQQIGRKDPNAQSCVELSEIDPQTIQANMMSAYCVNSFLTQIFAGKISTCLLNFNTMTGATTPRYLTKANIIKDWVQMHDSREGIFSFLYSLYKLSNGNFPFREWVDSVFHNGYKKVFAQSSGVFDSFQPILK